jgi:site-specific recombinase XerD
VDDARVEIAGAAHLVLHPEVTRLHPQEATYEAMLTGWQTQQRSRHLAVSTVEDRTRLVRRFTAFTNEYPWQWQPSDLEDWSASLVSRARPIAASTLRSYQLAIGVFLDYVTDRRYGWHGICVEQFGRAAVQVCHEWNTLAHTAEYEGRPGNRPFTREEIQAIFDHADERVDRARRLGRKGWLAAFRDATIFKTAYAWGLRRREVARLDLTDFTRNAHAPEFGSYGVLAVRWGKASKGSPPRRRNVLTVMEWAVETMTQYVDEVRPLYSATQHPALWLTERGGRVSSEYLNLRFAGWRAELGLPDHLGPHCLRHSYVTHLIEDGFDPFFVQQQVGHVWGSTTALYTGVSSDFKNNALRSALDRAFTNDERNPS